jgi:hypothetical protein
MLVAQCNEGYKGRGADVVAPPRPQSFYEKNSTTNNDNITSVC